MPLSKATPAPTGDQARPAARRAAALLVNAARPAKAKLVQIPVRPSTEQALAADPGLMTGLIEAYAEALAKSRVSGRSVRFEVDVNPDGAPGITAVEDATRPSTADTDRAPALDAARARGRVRVAEILSRDDMLSADAFASLLGTSRMTVNAWRQKGQVLGLEGAKRGYRFPAWQVDEHGKPFAALPALFERLGGGPWAVYFFLVRPHAELAGLTGLDAPRRGRMARVLDAAESVARGEFT
jgi:hypothetical protein